MRLLASAALVALLSFSACKSEPAPAPAPTAAPVPEADAAAAPAADNADAAPAPADAAPAPADAAPAPADAAAAPAGAELSAESTAVIEKGVTAIEEMSKLLSSGKDNCDKLGDDLKVFVDKNGEALTAFRKTMEGLPPAQQMAAQQQFEKRMEASMKGFMDGGMACQNNQKVKDAMSVLTGQPADAPPSPDMPDMQNAKAETPVIGKLADIVKAAGGDCAKLGKGLEPFVEKDLTDLKAFITKMQASQNPPMNGDMMVLMQALPQLQQCESEKSVLAIKAAFTGEQK